MGEYEPNDSRNVTGTASTQDGRWTGQAANDPTLNDRGQGRQQQGQQSGSQQQAGQQQAGQSDQQRAPQQSQGEIGQDNDGVSDASNQNNDHTSAIGQNQNAGANQGSGQPQQFQNTTGQQGGSGQQGDSRFADQLQKHQEVVDANGRHVGTVDHVDGDRVKLTRKDSPDGEHHYIALRDIAGVEGGKVRLSGAAGSGTQA
jgi:hypothetical protein